MNVTEILSQVDSEISRLQQVRNLLAGTNSASFTQVASGGKPLLVKKRTLSTEARERIAAAERKRWAKQKKAAKKTA
jgi:hypothetical protein